jgi:CDP-2,3-bis-(O-geranylgeranyl)-sn-glycerol synthase
MIVGPLSHFDEGAWVALLLVIVANATAWAAGRLIPISWRAPVDGDAILADHERVLGDHKTWGGLIAGVIACGTVALLLHRTFLLGVAFGALSLTGDCGSSFVKRRLRLRPGVEVPLLDQLPEALIPLLVLAHPLGLRADQCVIVVVVFSLLDVAASRLRSPR